MTELSHLLPRLRHAAFAVWRRNALVFRKFLTPSLFINFGEPFIYLLGLGYGLGMFIGNMMNMPYLTFLASGILASAAMNTASFEAMYSVYTRMVPQRTYDAILATPLEIEDVLAGEWLWSATKSLISAAGILAVAGVLGAVDGWRALWTLPVIFLIGLSFAGIGLIMSALARGYDFFNYYMTLVLTPMFILSGVFYPVTSLPLPLQTIVQVLPLTHAVELVRPLMAGLPLSNVALHVAVLTAYALSGFAIAVLLTRRRLLV
ncbi:MAG: nodulation protein NodJ [Acidithiobacillales bacterium SM23_46]|jgi:lipooligosaccharide transport system permease protein|nr:MAG: nodulation protein NodJ [Acidithiobacillales bacterium SM23_46]KPL28799.1 MAG: nodulation protein NodJ [Acidithiobacillales bacterium SM1_46]